MVGSAWTTVVPVNMVNVQTDTFGDDRFSPGVGCRVPLVRWNWDDMACWERPELLGDDSDSSEDCDFYDPRDYEEEWERNFAEEAAGYWLADSLHEDGGFVHFKDAFGPEPVLIHPIFWIRVIQRCEPVTANAEASTLPPGYGFC